MMPWRSIRHNRTFKPLRRRLSASCAAFAVKAGVSLELHANLITAAMDLKLVRLLRAAMQPKVPQRGMHGVPAPAPTLPGRPVHQPAPVLLPRTAIPAPPRLYRAPVVIFRPVIKPVPVECPADPCPAARPRMLLPLEPPWKTLPWQQPPQVPPEIKVVQHRSDIITKGSLIDFYV